MSQIIDQFCDSYFAAENITRKRQVQVRRQLLEFEAAIGKSILEATALDLEHHLSQRLQSLAPGTVRAHQYQIRPFFKWARRHDLIEAEVWRQIVDLPSPRGSGKTVPKPYTPDQMRRLWAMLERRYPAADEHWVERWMEGKSPYSRVRRHADRLQYEALIAAALYGGLRKGEVYRLVLDDLAPEHSTLPARSRKNREGVWIERKIPIIEPMHDAFSRWFAFRTALGELVLPDVQVREKAGPTDAWVYVGRGNDFGAKLDATYRTGKSDKHLTRLGVTGSGPHGIQWGFHRLRHTCATEMLRNGYKLHIVRKILGHSTLEQTLQYAELLDGDVVAESERVGGRFAAALARSRNGHGA